MKHQKLVQDLTIGLTALLVLIALPLYAFKVGHKTDYTDFEVYYRAAMRSKQGLWDQVYNLHDGASPFRYAPPLLILFRPFAEFTYTQAKQAWYYLQFIWFTLGFYFIYRSVRLTRVGRIKGSLWITCAAVLFTLRFCLDCFTIGQVSSQTIGNLAMLDSFSKRPILRPLIGFNKAEIIELSKKVGSHDISVIPHDDACSLFAPRHPVLRPDSEYVKSIVEQSELTESLKECLSKAEIYSVSIKGELEKVS